MKKRFCAFSLVFTLFLSQFPVLAVNEDNPSISGNEYKNIAIMGDNTEDNSITSEFTDMPVDPVTSTALEHAVENGLLQGSDGKINPDGILTRAELAAVMNRLLGTKASADLSGFTDVSESAWYYGEMSKAVGFGLLQGSGKHLMPSKDLTRQETFIIVARMLCLSGGTSSDLASFPDASSLASWAVDGTGALAKSYSIPTLNGNLAPTEYMTRAQFATLMDSIICKLVKDTETPENTKGSYFISEPDLMLSDVTIAHDLIITPGADGITTLKNVTVNGRLILLGGTLDVSDSSVSNVIIANNSLSSFSTDMFNNLSTLELTQSCNALAVEGSIQTLKISADSGTYTFQNLNAESLTVGGQNNTLNLSADAQISQVALSGSSNTVNLDGTINYAKLSGNDNTVKGTGFLTNAEITGRSCQVSVPGTAITDNVDYGIEKAILDIQVSNVQPGGSIAATATISGVPTSTLTTAKWYVNDKLISGYTSPYFHAKTGVTSTLKQAVTFSRNMKNTATITFKLTSRNGIERTCTKQIKINNYSSSYYDELENPTFSILLGKYTTKFAPSNKNRTTNLRVATKAINGTVISAGGSFSFNKTVGERTTARGYKEAIVIEEGSYTPGLGGGVCQVSTTLFNAALLSNMTITQRYNHSLRSSYVSAGRDATVAYGSKDFQFKNPYSRSIKITATFNEKGSLTFYIYGQSGITKSNPSINVTKSGKTYTLTRTVNGTVNYRTSSTYLN